MKTMQLFTNISTMDYYLSIKKWNFVFVTTQVDGPIVMLSEIGQRKANAVVCFCLYVELKK